MKNQESLKTRFWSKVNKEGPVPIHVPELGPCWLWTGHVTEDGYGQLQVGSRTDGSRRKELAHRVAWYFAHGRWPTPCGLHKCDTRACVRFEHIFEGTNADNVRDRNIKQRQSRGEGRPTAKLTEDKAREIMRRKAEGCTTRDLAKEFGVSKTVAANVGRTSWLHAADPQLLQGMDRYKRRRGADHSNAKITEAQAMEILRRKKEGERKATLAREFGISATTVDRIGRTQWIHLLSRRDHAVPTETNTLTP